MSPTHIKQILLKQNTPDILQVTGYDYFAEFYQQCTLNTDLQSQVDALLTYCQRTNRLPELARLFKNPFGDQGRIEDPSRFFGRQAILNYIFVELAAGRNVSLVGPAQVGKSSVLSQMVQQGSIRLNRPSYEFVYIDM